MSDINIFIPENNKVNTVGGEAVGIPKLSWKKELRLLQIIQESINELIKSSVELKSTSTEQLVSVALKLIPNRLTEFMSIVMDRPGEWVEDNLDSTEIIGVIVPLLKSRLDLITQKIQPFVELQKGQNPVESLQTLQNVTKNVH